MHRVSRVWPFAFVAVWWSLASPRTDVWVPGALAVLAGTLLHRILGGRGFFHLRLRGLASFLPFFLAQMVRGGVDVSRRAMSPSLPLDPDFIRYPIRLPGSAARVFFINCISLLPGTFSARLEGSEIIVHRLSADLVGEELLQALERRVGAVFDMEPVGSLSP